MWRPTPAIPALRRLRRGWGLDPSSRQQGPRGALSQKHKSRATRWLREEGLPCRGNETMTCVQCPCHTETREGREPVPQSHLTSTRVLQAASLHTHHSENKRELSRGTLVLFGVVPPSAQQARLDPLWADSGVCSDQSANSTILGVHCTRAHKAGL